MSKGPANAPPPWRDEKGELLPGAPLLAAAAAFGDPTLKSADFARISEDLGFPVPAFEAARRFFERLARATPETPLQICHGLSCAVEGAEGYRDRLIEALEGAGSKISYEAVHCLDHCLEGPNVRFGAETFCAKSCVVVEDERTWRSADAGPRKIDASGAPPVLD
jgi:NADH:ubiquinone oxidoreductase subunit E